MPADTAVEVAALGVTKRLAPMQPGAIKLARRDREVEVQIPWNQRSLRATGLSRGATWDPQRRLWRMPRHLAQALYLQTHVSRRT